MKRLLVVAGCAGLLAASCASLNSQQKGTGLGVVAGGLLGGLIAKNNNALGVLIGAAIGGAAGNLIGNKMDKTAASIKQEIPGASVERVGEGIDITFDSDMLFKKGADQLTDSATQAIASLAAVFVKYTDTEILVEGHTSADPKLASSENEKANNELSMKRALAVGSTLKANGVAAGRVVEKWYGGARPKYSNENEEERQKNRRVEIAVIAGEKMRAEAQAGTLQ
jgi:outer membrane protein OmpA-like peptidoglycan-associated protein